MIENEIQGFCVEKIDEKLGRVFNCRKCNFLKNNTYRNLFFR